MKASFKHSPLSIRHCFMTCALLSAVISCTEAPLPHEMMTDRGVRIPLSLSCEPLEGEVARSSHADESLTRISNVNYYLFHDRVLVVQEYFDNPDNFSVKLPSTTEDYNLYILANAGKMAVSDETPEIGMDSAVHVDYGSATDYFSTIEECGFPMAAMIENFSAESSREHKLRRLVHTLYLKMDTSGLNTTSMEFTGVSIRQAARDVFPFAAESKALHTIDGDAANLDGDDIARLNAGETIRLFMLENMRGELISGNTNWKDKVPDNISPASEKSMASYIELTARAQTLTATYEKNIYRTYLGTSPSDFNVRRSTCYNITSSFTNDMIVGEDWRIEGDTPEITAKLAFVDTKYTTETAPRPDDTGNTQYRPFREVDAFYTMKGFTAIYYIYRSDPRIEYTLSMEATNTGSSDCGTYMKYMTRKIDDHFTELVINTYYPVLSSNSYLSGNPEFEEGKSVTFILRSADGVIEDRLVCRAITSPFGLLFAYDGVTASTPVTDNGVLNMYFTNPLGLSIRVEVQGQVKGYVSYKPNGTAFAAKTKSPSVSINTGNKYDESSFGSTSGYVREVIPVTGEPSRIDIYKDKTGTAGAIYESEGFFEYFKEIWNTTGWDSYTVLNGSNGYYKHARPTELTLNMKISFACPNRHLIPHSVSGNVFQLPVYFRNRELTRDTSTGAYYGGGTDIGFIWHQYDKEGAAEYVTYKFTKSTRSPDVSYYSGANQLPVSVTINGSPTWKTDGTGIPCSTVYDESYLSDLGVSL